MQAYADAFPAEQVARFIDEGRQAGERAIAIATPEHIRTLRASSSAAPGLKPTLYIDAEQALEALLVDGRPDAERFDATLGATVRSAAWPGTRRVRAFGEMVSLLCDRGQPEAALELEKLWNRLAQGIPLMLLCTYGAAALAESRQVQDLIVAQHARVLGPSHGAGPA